MPAALFTTLFNNKIDICITRKIDTKINIDYNSLSFSHAAHDGPTAVVPPQIPLLLMMIITVISVSAWLHKISPTP